mgnify:CR=1 FL=1
MGNTLQDAEKIDEAEENYKNAIALDPKHTRSHHNLALIHEKKGQIIEALNNHNIIVTITAIKKTKLVFFLHLPKFSYL